MKNILSKVKDSKGFVSLETIAVALIIIVLAAIVMIKFKGTVSTSSGKVNNTITSNTDTINQEGTYSGGK